MISLQFNEPIYMLHNKCNRNGFDFDLYVNGINYYPEVVTNLEQARWSRYKAPKFNSQGFILNCRYISVTFYIVPKKYFRFFFG